MELRLDGRRRLSQVLQDYLTHWSDRTGIGVEVWALPEGDVPHRIAEALLATVREAFDNVERHSRAGTVSIAVTLGPSGLRMTISDDGIGFPPGTAGRGQIVMRANFMEISGALSINSVPGAGTTISAVVPRKAL
jgi:signal transduction histidine kinase